MNIDKIEKLAEAIIKVKLNTATSKERELLNEWLFADDANLKVYSNIMSGDFLASKYMMEEEFSQIYNISIIKREIVEKITSKHKKRNFLRFRTAVATSAAIFVLAFAGYSLYNGLIDDPLLKQTPDMTKTMASKIKPYHPREGKVVLESYNGDKIELNREIDAVIENKTAKLFDKSVKKTGEQLLNTITTPKGMTYNIVLSDGTKVWLNESSKLIYPIEFLGDRREVTIEGEAFFEVTHDIEMPFFVVGKKGSVRVLGTKFNFVSSDEQFIATLVEGSVEVHNAKNRIVIHPSQQATVGDDIEVREVDVRMITAWKDGKYIFKSENLSEIMNHLAGWYNLTIEYDDSSKKEIKLSGVLFKFTTFAEVIEVLEATKQISVKVKDGNTVKVFFN